MSTKKSRRYNQENDFKEEANWFKEISTNLSKESIAKIWDKHKYEDASIIIYYSNQCKTWT